MRGSYYQRLVVVILVSVSLCFASFRVAAATAPAYNGKMNAAVGGIVQMKVSKWGFAANDPRVTATYNGITVGLTSVAVGLATGAVATVGWPALLVAAVVSAVVTGAVSLASSSVYTWLFNSDGTITTTSPAVSGTLIAGGPYVRGSKSGLQYPAPHDFGQAKDNWERLCKPYNQCDGRSVVAGQVLQSSEQGRPITTYHYNVLYNGNLYTNFSLTLYQVGAAATCPAGQLYDNGICMAIPNQAPTELRNASVADAVANIPTSELTKPASNQLLAAATNAAWKAANIGNGLPWSALDPVTPADVAEWRAANPSLVPTVGDVIALASNSSTVSVAPVGGTQVGPAPTPGTGSQIDLGPNPNTPPPTLEAIPTAQQILGPLLNLMPDLRAFVLPSHTSSCPVANFTLFSKAYAVDSHCTLIESNRSLIEAALLLCWTLASAFIVLRA